MTESKPKPHRKRAARLTADRRASAAKIKKQIEEEGISPLPKDPPLVDDDDRLIPPKYNSKYRPEYAGFARELCRLGATDIEVARGLSVSLNCLWHWQATHEEFFKAFLEGKEYCDSRVERALYHRAVGYDYPTVKITSYQGEAVVVPYIEHIPPDVGAASKWLKSRKREDWGDKQEVSISGDESFSNLWKLISDSQVLPIASEEDIDDDGEITEAEIIEDDK